jgi:DNA-binding GntR family transcriptional regulator
MTQLPLDLAAEMPPAPARPQRSFHVRSHVTAEEAQAGEARARTQEAQVLEWLRRFTRSQRFATGSRWTPSEIARAFSSWPLTSVRRALTNLTTAGLLTHWPGDRRPGPFGAKESTWSIAEGDQS